MGESSGLSKGAKASTSPITIAKDILKNEGVKSLYKGLDSALVRQATYATARLGIYNTLSDYRKR